MLSISEVSESSREEKTSAFDNKSITKSQHLHSLEGRRMLKCKSLFHQQTRFGSHQMRGTENR